MFTTEAFYNGRIVLHGGDSRAVVKTLPPDSIDSLVSDTPYALESIRRRFGAKNAAPAIAGKTGAYARASAGFMGSKWDTGDVAHDPEFWKDCFRVLKPGAYVAVFGGTRTSHRLAAALETAGFEIRDTVINIIDPASPVVAFIESLDQTQLGAFLRCLDDAQFGGLLAWVFGTGFPKSHNIAMRFEKTLCRRVDREWRYVTDNAPICSGEWRHPTAFDLQGFGTALKPAFEPIIVARKPLSEDTVAANVVRWRTGVLNIDSSRVPGEAPTSFPKRRTPKTDYVYEAGFHKSAEETAEASTLGRWPANVVTDGSDEVVGAFPNTKSGQLLPHHAKTGGSQIGTFEIRDRSGEAGTFGGDCGSAARFYYSGKANKSDRAGSKHPTIKPVGLKQWLVRLVTPPGGIILDPFAGTGTTGEAAVREGFRCIMVEREEKYLVDVRRRMGLIFSGPEERTRAEIKSKPVSALPLFVASKRKGKGHGAVEAGAVPLVQPPDDSQPQAIASDAGPLADSAVQGRDIDGAELHSRQPNQGRDDSGGLERVSPSSSALLARLRQGLRPMVLPRVTPGEVDGK